MIKAPYTIFGIENIDQNALNQFYDALNCDFAVVGALMPDAHSGYSLPIGGVVATKNTVVPAWVGYDIGCGMCACPTTFNFDLIQRHSQEIFNEIYKHVPMGFSHQQRNKASKKSLDLLNDISTTKWFSSMFRENNGFNQLGTLGSGNHFIEIGHDINKQIWIIIHSGSRNVGHKTATNYMKIASNSNKAKEGHYGLDINSAEGHNYLTDSNYCLEFALQNRITLLQEVESCINNYITGEVILTQLINRNHNHVDYNKNLNLWIHRKGATHAEKDMLGVIPGNMRDGSFIVQGLGNKDSLYSSSHGAGRTKSRKQAKEDINIEKLTEQMSGITAKVVESTKDESPDAYKSIFEVMEMQKDLVKVINYIQPIINIKA